jgi:hypothetical protein
LEAEGLSEVVHSVNIMLAILLVGVCVTIYWIFKYDDWNPNPIIINEHTSASIPDSRGDDSEDKGA